MKFYPTKQAYDGRDDANMGISRFTEGNHVLTHAFVREFFQNALDAVDDKQDKVVVKIKLVTLTDQSDKDYLRETYKDIIPLLKTTSTEPIENHRYLVIEEFNTTGLTGTSEFHPEESELEKAHWSNFSFGLMRPSKAGDKGGRTGIGKIMLNLLSGLRLVIYRTKRSTDDEDWLGGRVEFNRSAVFGNGSEKTRYSNWGWLTGYQGEDIKELTGPEKEKIYRPIKDKEILDEVDRIFGLERSKDDYGTSWIIPSPLEQDKKNSEVTELEDIEAIINHTIDDFSWAFMDDFLKVDFDGLVVHANNIIDILDERIPEKKDLWGFLDEIRTCPTNNLLDVDKSWQDSSSKKLTEEGVTDPEELKKLLDKYNNNEVVGFSFPIIIKKKKEIGASRSTKSFGTQLKVFLQKPENAISQKHELFLRKWLIISGENSIRQNARILGVTLIDSFQLSAFCAYAELPDHRKFSPDKIQLKERYTNIPTTLANIRRAARTAYESLNITDNQSYEDYLAEIFGVPLASGIKRKTKRKKKKVVPPNPQTPREPTKVFVEIEEGFSPFIVKPGQDLIDNQDCPLKIEITCSTIGFLKGKNEFDMGERGFLDSEVVDSKNCNIEIIDNGKLSIEITDPDFYLELDEFKSRFHTTMSLKY